MFVQQAKGGEDIVDCCLVRFMFSARLLLMWCLVLGFKGLPAR
jgi:hypothetical protein